MQEVELTSARLVRVWWAFAWRFAALWFVLGATLLVAALLSVIALMRMGILTEPHALKMGGKMLAAIVFAGAPVAGIIATRLVLQGQLGGFRLALMLKQDGTQSAAQPPTAA